jgi:hypothetical protein
MSRLQAVLSTGMMEHGMHHHHHGGSRKVLMIKGLAFGVQDEKIEEAYTAAKRLIAANGITTIIWDGDPMQHRNSGGYFHGSFTAVIDKLMMSHQQLEYIYFKKSKGVEDLITGIGKVEEEKFGDPYKNVLGPFEHLTTSNTSVLDGDANEPPSGRTKNYGVKFVKTWDGSTFYMLGLKGLMYIKNVLGADTVNYLIVGVGGAVKKELKEVSKDPNMFPTIAQTPIAVQRD